MLAVAAVVSELAAWALRTVGSKRQEHGEKGRRRALLIEAYGDTQEPIDVTDLRHDFSARAERLAPDHDNPTYWSTSAPLGSRRLIGQLQESAFWSKHLYREAAKRAAIVSAVAGIVTLACLLALITVDSDEARLAVARIVVVFLAFLITADGISRQLAWSSAAGQASDVDRRLEKCDANAAEAVLAIWSDYSVATATAPPIPSGIYRENKDRLEQEWAARRAN